MTGELWVASQSNFHPRTKGFPVDVFVREVGYLGDRSDISVTEREGTLDQMHPEFKIETVEMRVGGELTERDGSVSTEGLINKNSRA